MQLRPIDTLFGSGLQQQTLQVGLALPLPKSVVTLRVLCKSTVDSILRNSNRLGSNGHCKVCGFDRRCAAATPLCVCWSRPGTFCVEASWPKSPASPSYSHLTNDVQICVRQSISIQVRMRVTPCPCQLAPSIGFMKGARSAQLHSCKQAN